jgi:hypothetical protein
VAVGEGEKSAAAAGSPALTSNRRGYGRIQPGTSSSSIGDRVEGKLCALGRTFKATKAASRRPTVGRAPEALRSALLHLLGQQAVDSEGEFDPHHLLSRVLGKIGTEWGPSEKWQAVRNWVNSLTIDQVQQVLNEVELSAREEEFIKTSDRTSSLLSRTSEHGPVFWALLLANCRAIAAKFRAQVMGDTRHPT